MQVRPSLAMLLLAAALPSAAATRTWNGSVSASWSATANWDEGAVPVAGDDLVFKIGAANLTNNDNLAAGLAFGSITFQQGGYTIQGNSFSLTAGINGLNATGSNTIQPAISFATSNQTIKVVSGGALVLSGSASIGAGVTLGFQADGAVTMSGAVSGAGGMAIGGTGTLTLSGNNTYSGLTIVAGQATLIAANSSALGNPAFGAQILSGATLALQGGINVQEGIDINGIGVSSGGALVSTSGVNTFSGPITLNAASANYIGVAPGSTLTISGVLSSPAGMTTPLTKVGGGTLVLTNANAYTGPTTVLVGDVNVQNPSALGDVANGTVVAFGAALEIQGGLDVAEPLSLNGLGISSQGALRSVSGGNAVTGPVTLASDSAIGVDSGSVLIVQGNVDGSGYLRKAGAGTLILSGTNSYTGQTRVTAGVLRAQSGAALGDPTTGTIVLTGAALELQGNINIGTEPLDLSGTGVAGGGALRNVGGVNGWAGPITLSTASSVSVAAGTLNITGAISGASSLTKIGGGALFLSGTNSYTGGTNVSAGMAIVNGSLDAASTVSVAGGATLGGSGTVGVLAVASNGIVSPGQSPGILGSGNATFTSGSTFTVEIGGTAPGTGYDQLNVTGSVTLGGANLSASILSGFVPPPFSTYTIVANDGADPVSGTFAGLPEGTFLTIGGYRFLISYAGGDGNDVSLTRVPVTKTWTGATSSFWSIGSNWMGGAPVAGDDLVFPAGAANLNNTNDFPAGFAVNSILISGSGYTLHTNQAVLYNGITTTNPANANIVNSGGSLAQAQTFACTNAGALLTLTGSYTWDGFDLTVAGAGATTASGLGVFSGTGNLVKNGTGTLTITGNNSYTGTTLVNAGAVNVQASAAFGTGAAAVTVAGAGAAIQIQGSLTLAKPLVLNGNGVAGTGAIQVLSGTSSWTGPVQLASATLIEVDAGELTISGIVSGAGDLTKTNSGRLILTNTNTFTGSVTVGTGPLRITNGGSLGGTTNGVFLVSGTLEIADAAVGAETLTFSSGGAGGTLRSVAGVNSWAGDVALQTAGTFSADPGSELAVNGVISGSFGVSKQLGGTIDFGGANTYTGATTVNAGVLGITNGLALGTPAGSTAVLSGGTLRIDGGAAGITVANEFLALNGNGGGAGALQVVNGPNVYNGTISLITADATIAVGAGSSLTAGGFVTNSGGLTKVGPGTLTLLASNNYSGATTIGGGTLLVDGVQSQPAFVNAGATLGGTGSVGAVTSTSGTVSPGNSPGILSTGNLSLDASSTFAVQLNGTTPGTGYDRLAVTGSVALGSATLTLTVGYTPSPGDTFTIIQNDGTLDPVSGTFAGLADGAMFTSGVYQFQIFYTGGDGNDVVLSYIGCVSDVTGPAVTPPTAVTVTQTLCQ